MNICSSFLWLFQKVLAKHGASRISAYVTHGIFPNRSWERFERDNGGTYILYVTFHKLFAMLLFLIVFILCATT
mgnify:CR=1 FL=1